MGFWHWARIISSIILIVAFIVLGVFAALAYKAGLDYMSILRLMSGLAMIFSAINFREMMRAAGHNV